MQSTSDVTTPARRPDVEHIRPERRVTVHEHEIPGTAEASGRRRVEQRRRDEADPNRAHTDPGERGCSRRRLGSRPEFERRRPREWRCRRHQDECEREEDCAAGVRHRQRLGVEREARGDQQRPGERPRTAGQDDRSGSEQGATRRRPAGPGRSPEPFARLSSGRRWASASTIAVRVAHARAELATRSLRMRLILTLLTRRRQQVQGSP